IQTINFGSDTAIGCGIRRRCSRLVIRNHFILSGILGVNIRDIGLICFKTTKLSVLRVITRNRYLIVFADQAILIIVFGQLSSLIIGNHFILSGIHGVNIRDICLICFKSTLFIVLRVITRNRFLIVFAHQAILIIVFGQLSSLIIGNHFILSGILGVNIRDI